MEESAPLWVHLLGFVMAFGIPSIFLFFGIWMLAKTQRFMANARKISATVVETGKTYTSDAGRTSIDYLPVYEYRGMDGGMIRARAFRSTATPPVIGSQQTMLVDPNEPEVVRFSSVAGYGFAAFGILIGGAALITMFIIY